MKPRILIVEDDRAAAQLVMDGLSMAGYGTSHVTGAEEALGEIRDAPPDLIVLDIQLGGLSGLQLCEILRKNSATAALPILMLTSLRTEREKVAGLRGGADDYMTKPFSEAELLARVEALLRRARGHAEENVYRSGDTVLDLDRREVTVKGTVVDLTPLEFDLLLNFLKRPGKVLPFALLAGRVWGDRVATRHTMTVTISRLREKLGSAGPRLQSVAGIGYKWV